MNEISLHIIPNVWSSQAYVEHFDFKYVLLKNYINMFERMEISENAYKGVV